MPAAGEPKYLEIARTIESLLRGGDGVKVPSSREVAALYGVSVVTASRALQALRGKGLIRTVERSGSYRVPALPAAGARECYALAQRSTPGPWLQASLSFNRAGFAAVGRREGVRFETDLFDFEAAARPAEIHRQARRAAESGVSGVVFMPSRASVEAAGQDEAFARSCRDAGLPVVLIERNLRGFARSLEYDLVAADDLDGGLRCTGHLLDQGRSRIAFVIGSPTSSHEGRLAGYLTALNRAGEGRAPLVLEQRGGLDSKAAYADLADRLLAHHVDGVVCYQDYTALGLILELMTRGVRVPRDVAITGFDDLPIGKAFSIGVTTYAFSSEALARQALRLMRARLADKAGPPVKVLIPGELIVRESSVLA